VFPASRTHKINYITMKAFLLCSLFASGVAVGYLLHPGSPASAQLQVSNSATTAQAETSQPALAASPVARPLTETLKIPTRSQQTLAADVARISSMTDDELARESYKRWLYTLSAEECATAPAQVELIEPIYLRDWAKIELLDHWSSLQPETAAKYCSTLRANETQAMMAERVASNWATKDPAAALAWAKTFGKGVVRERALINVCEKLVLKDPAAALELAGNEFSAQTLDDAHHRMISLWSGNDFKAAQQWLQNITDLQKKHTLMLSSLTGHAQHDPEAAARFVAQMPAAEHQAEAAVEVAQLWAARDPAAAAQWISQFPPGLARERTLETVMSHFAKRDPSAAHTWLMTLKPGTEKDAAIASLVRELVEGDIQTAPSYLGQVADPLLRDELRQMIQLNGQRYGH
jgi:hypothetical protein